MALTAQQYATDPLFWGRVDTNGPVPAHAPELGPCWLWTGATDQHGEDNVRGRVKRRSKTWLVHRWAWTLLVGPIPAGVLLDHRCFTTTCVRPSHLRHSTPSLNGQNRSRMARNNSSGFRGVYWHKGARKWMAYGRAPGRKNKYLGVFDDVVDAAVAAWEYRREHHTANDLDPHPRELLVSESTGG